MSGRYNSDAGQGPTIVHVTHYKAGSQWIRKILQDAAPDQAVRPIADRSQFLVDPIIDGGVYPAVYVTREEFAEVDLPPGTKHFIVVRDLRDTLISGYFSVKRSHNDFKVRPMQELREKLNEVDVEEGLQVTLDRWLPGSARIQQSWIESGEKLLKYEELLENDIELLEPTLIDECGMQVGRRQLRRAIRGARFERLTGGRKPGDEDTSAHQRKGIAGDWRNHFTDDLKDAFKERFGDQLIASGYESDNDW